MDIQSILAQVLKSGNVKDIAKQTGESPANVKSVIESALPDVLGNILGGSNNHDAAAATASKKSGVDVSTVMTILGLVAPLVIAYITNQKSSGTTQKAANSDNPLIDLANTVLDKNHDGNFVDDILGGVSSSSNKGGGNILTNILGSIFGKK
jgi:hypothetical protein